MAALTGFAFEVHGKVQGVYFRKHTEAKAKELAVTGWCKNTDAGTVVGEAQGSRLAIEELRTWLENVGSPLSRIDKVVFTNEDQYTQAKFDCFSIVK